MKPTPVDGDKVLFKKEALTALRLQSIFWVINNIQSPRWEEVLTVIFTEPLPAYFPISLKNLDGDVIAVKLEEIIFPIPPEIRVKTCQCEIRILMNRGCQCGAKQ